MQHGNGEAINGQLREELLNETLSFSMGQTSESEATRT